ncbi:hypothetical protein AVEN_216576-1 [Araneus ventricosus]|uniref:Uncharacterized protein n=1 Tax=Araneus ventricosus TaxID=182803 RepID=A0A4Y2G2H1_ARAVE|nr:hypothetical protein AVEN_216576-1 [Araneus ventricosus]
MLRGYGVFSQHGPFPAYLKRFHQSDSDYCSCGGIGTALHYATECIYTVFWHMRKPAPNFEQEWLKRVANNLVSRKEGNWVGCPLRREKFPIFWSTAEERGGRGGRGDPSMSCQKRDVQNEEDEKEIAFSCHINLRLFSEPSSKCKDCVIS